MEYKIFLGYLALIIEAIAYAIYFVGIYRGKTKPHAFTWLVWGTLNAIGFAAVLISGGESVAVVLGVNALACFSIAAFGFKQHRVIYDKYDWAALSGAFIGIFLWWLTSDPLYAVVLISISDGVGMVPTYRKSYRLPFEENLSSFALGIFYYLLALLALNSFAVTNWLYPAAILIFDSTLVLLIIVRRRKMKN